jgi:hypothetical protein
MSTITQIIADAYRKMVNPPQAVARPKWVPASITEESVPAFVQAVTEARKANKSIVKFDGKRYGITVKEETNKEDDNKSKKIQDMDTENALKQASDEVPSEVKEEDAEEIKMDNHDEKEKDAEEMQRISASEAPGDKRAEMAEKLVGNQHKLDVNKNGKIDGEDLKKLRGEEKEEDSEEEHPEPDADNMGGPSDHDADNKGEDENEDEKPKMTGEQTIASVAATYAAMVNENESINEAANTHSIWHLHGRHADAASGGYMADDDRAHSKKKAIEKHVEKKHGAEHKADMMAHSRLHNAVSYAQNPSRKVIDNKLSKMRSLRNKHGIPHHGFPQDSHDMNHWHSFNESTNFSDTEMVNENVAGDPHAHNLTNKANELTALAHSSGSDTHHEDAQHAHHLAAEHYRVYAHQHHDPMVRGAANIHHEFHRSMYNHHMLHLVSADQDREASDAAAKHYGKKSVEEGTAADASMVNENDEYAGDNPADKLHLDVPAFIRVLERAREDFKTDEDIHNFTQQLIAMKSDCIRTADLPSSPVKEGTAADAEAGPEVMDPVTQKAKDDTDDETEIKDGVPGAAQDGGDKVTPADKPAPANSSAALPKVPVITAPVMTNESMTAIITRKNSDGSYDEVGMSNKTVVRGSHSNILKKAKEYAKGPHRVELFHGDRIGHGSPHKVIHSE